MRLRTLFAVSTALALLPLTAQAQTTEQATVDGADGASGDIVVTARKRSESLLDVPIAATAISGDTLTARGINSVREAAALAPGLSINSDGTGRAFVAIRGVGVTLVQSVQPGVGLFIDGIYQPNTSYLNNPLNDVERIEVLRGPQGTLYGKNTLGGAINVITRQPGNDFEVRGNASYAGPDDSWGASAAISAPIVTDVLAIRIAAAHRQQDGFLRNVTIGGDANAFSTDSVNATIRLTPQPGFSLTVKGYYNWVDGANTPYARVTGPQNYSRDIQFNTLNRTQYRYRGINARAEADLGGGSRLSLIGAYDLRNSVTLDGEGDFGPANVVRSSGSDELRTQTIELRLNSDWSRQFSSLFGLFTSYESFRSNGVTRVIPLNIANNAQNLTDADTYAAFGTVFWKPNTDWEVSAGLRYDYEDRRARGFINGARVAPATIKSSEWQPRLSVTRHWTGELMTYASVARGYRGGGFNAVTAPTRTYRGDSAWTYELGSRYVSSDRAVTLSGALFYSDYKDYIGLNSIAPSSTGGLVTVDLNTGDVESYGLELEGVLRPITNWSITGGLTLMHARIVDASAYTATTRRVLASDRLTFQPDVMGSINSDYVIPIGDDDAITLTAGATYKGKRLAATLNQTAPTFLDGYTLVNASIAYRHGGLEFAVFANNLLQADYFESYIEKTTLQLAGLPASDLGIVGDRRRVGARVNFKF